MLPPLMCDPYNLVFKKQHSPHTFKKWKQSLSTSGAYSRRARSCPTADQGSSRGPFYRQDPDAPSWEDEDALAWQGEDHECRVMSECVYYFDGWLSLQHSSKTDKTILRGSKDQSGENWRNKNHSAWRRWSSLSALSSVEKSDSAADCFYCASSV